ncbi:hypothetical protein LY28_00106 [Ruminiclostridium sufflavum DSM 19573]|uniref:Butirosin biosynthesis protein H-like n=1 Tax=Ruminiclostridium sufflavum DSM 19573 TaxID=1121337 RepID=A0A318XPF6_9FIRM|nr:hypothetical protein [Ruminiclostridium sufflavum]PYG90226.1 hypothetical protein LY28_00106 [Ruminiclostridium sufflavum DSM 19573]
MKCFLDMSHYCTDGFRNDNTTCIDIPIAVSAGYYSYENYFYYLFYHSALHNWTDISLKDWQGLKSTVARKMGLELVPNTIGNSSEVIPKIKEKLDLSIPVMMPTKYKALFYFYLSGNPDAAHFILISGYDTKRGYMYIRDINHLYEAGVQQYMTPQATGLFGIFMTEKMLEDIWTDSNKFFKEEGGPQSQEYYCFDSMFHNILYSLEKRGEPEIDSYDALIRDFCKNIAYKDNRFITAVRQYNDTMKNIREYALGFEIAFFRCLNVIFGVIEKWLQSHSEEPGADKLLQEFAGIRSRHFEYKRETVFAILEAAKSSTEYSSDKIKSIIGTVKALDSELFEFVQGALQVLVK